MSTEDRPRFFERQDLLVVLVGLALLAVGGLGYHSSTAPTMDTYEQLGLEFQWPGNWLPREEVPPAPLRLMAGGETEVPRPPVAGEVPFHEIYSYAQDPDLRLEVRIDQRPGYSNLRGALSFERRNRYGELYRQVEGRTVTIDGTDWLLTRFQYAYKPSKSHSPRTSTGVEYATVAGDRLYVVTLHGTPRATDWLSSLIGPTLSVPAGASAAPMSALLSTNARISREVVVHALPSVVMVMVVDLRDGRLVPVSSGSGTIVHRNGSVLTNFHVINDEERGRLHDLFVIGRFRAQGAEPEYVCAGRPNRSKLLPDQDLALIKCDLDMDGQQWTPHDWPALPIDLAETADRGERVWVIGYPDVSGGSIGVSTGEITGTVNDDTDGEVSVLVSTASITYGSSGGAAVDEQGFYVGVPSAFRARATINGTQVTRMGDEGLIRPVQRAADLIAIAQGGWTPTLGDTQIIAGTRPPPTDEVAGIEISSYIRDAANDNPVAGAVVIVFKPEITADDVDMNRLHTITHTWARTDEQGAFTLPRRLPAGTRYTVAVMAKGYQPLIGTNALSLPEDAPGRYDPWGEILLER